MFHLKTKKMTRFYRFLFPASESGLRVSLLLLAERALLGGLILSHGLQKVAAFGTLSSTFPDPLGIGSTKSLLLAIFAEVVCSAALIVGFLHRLVLIPLIVTMGVAFFSIHAADPWAVKELPFVYMTMFVLLFLAGPGRFSMDGALGARLQALVESKPVELKTLSEPEKPKTAPKKKNRRSK